MAKKMTKAAQDAWIARKEAERADLSDRLDEWLAAYDELDDDERELVDAQVKHWMTSRGYSERNAMLVCMQAPEATEVKTYPQWLEVGRQVKSIKNGTRPIRIVQYKGAKVRENPETGQEEETSRRFYKIISVFDRSDTYPAEEAVA